METEYNLRSKIKQLIENNLNGFCYSHVNSKGITYYLHKKDVVLGRNHYKRTNYYFAKSVMPEFACSHVPEGKKIVEHFNGLLFLANN